MSCVRYILLLLIVLPWSSAYGQQTVFSIMKGPEELGDRNVDGGEYAEAITNYIRILDRDPKNIRVLTKVAQCQYNIKDYKRCVATYDKVLDLGGQLSPNEMFHYAEAQSSLRNYLVAIAWYKKCLERNPGDELVSKKVWALSNISFLMEDSSHYVVRPVTDINSKASELGATVFANGVVYTSNLKGSRPVDLASDLPNGPFYELVFAAWETDSATNARSLSKKPSKFGRSMGLSYNTGPVAFYDHKSKMVFVGTAAKPGADGHRTLGLYFATMEDNSWKVAGPYEHNSDIYSITDVTINEDGTKMYFSSAMKGGTGGKDIYTSSLNNGRWSEPVNLGAEINTKGDEVFPYLHRNGTLYFSSDGLAGMGGLDVFQSIIKPAGFSEPENVGYPINSNGDDFGLTFDSLATRGFFTSNRVNGGLDDDIYEFEMDLQTYPFQMSGVLRYKDHTWSDTLDIHQWPNVSLDLIDTWQDLKVQETVSGPDGSFTLIIPYFSRYHILITDEKGNRHKASLDLEKYRTETNKHEIVVVKDLFTEINEPREK
jgi:tetratricopeptide (TPR) repeat protein